MQRSTIIVCALLTSLLPLHAKSPNDSALAGKLIERAFDLMTDHGGGLIYDISPGKGRDEVAWARGVKKFLLEYRRDRRNQDLIIVISTDPDLAARVTHRALSACPRGSLRGLRIICLVGVQYDTFLGSVARPTGARLDVERVPKVVPYCEKHHVPIISVIGYVPLQGPERIVMVHDHSPEALKCDNQNRLPDDASFHRTKIHSVRGIITFCPVCDAEYLHCYGGDRQLTHADVQEITSLVMQRPEFRKPILRIFAVESPRAIVIGGNQQRVGEVYSEIDLKKHGNRWVVAAPASSYRIVEIGPR